VSGDHDGACVGCMHLSTGKVGQIHLSPFDLAGFMHV
jgi:hypothetical protein